jgi:hypothetical protein
MGGYEQATSPWPDPKKEQRNMSRRKKLSKELVRDEIARRMKEIDSNECADGGGYGLFRVMAEQRVREKQREEWWDRCEAEYPLVVQDVKRCLRAQMGLPLEAQSSSDSASVD